MGPSKVGVPTPSSSPVVAGGVPPRLVAAVAGLFFFYVLHDALQERAFRTDGFRFGWWMTLNELTIVSALAWLLELGPSSSSSSTSKHQLAEDDDDLGEGKKSSAPLRMLPPLPWCYPRGGLLSLVVPPTTPTASTSPPPLKAEEHPDSRRLRRLVMTLSIALTVSQGAGSAALAFVTFPLKVAFKSSKLCPTMLFGVMLTGKRYTWIDYAAALMLGASLATLSFADARYAGGDDKKLHELGIGCVLLTSAVCADALVPNLQEKVLKELRYPTASMIVWSNCASTVLTFCYVAASGELVPAVRWSAAHPDGATYLVLQSFASYFGLRCYLLVVKTVSGVGGVVVTTFRKVVTIVLSYVLFKKAFSVMHLGAFALLGAGVALATYGKYHHAKKPAHASSGDSSASSSSEKEDGRPASSATDPHSSGGVAEKLLAGASTTTTTTTNGESSATRAS